MVSIVNDIHWLSKARADVGRFGIHRKLPRYVTVCTKFATIFPNIILSFVFCAVLVLNFLPEFHIVLKLRLSLKLRLRWCTIFSMHNLSYAMHRHGLGLRRLEVEHCKTIFRRFGEILAGRRDECSYFLVTSPRAISIMECGRKINTQILAYYQLLSPFLLIFHMYVNWSSKVQGKILCSFTCQWALFWKI